MGVKFSVGQSSKRITGAGGAQSHGQRPASFQRYFEEFNQEMSFNDHIDAKNVFASI